MSQMSHLNSKKDWDSKKESVNTMLEGVEAMNDSVLGFAFLAAEIAKDKYKTTHIYRSYGRLLARNLLYLESEVASI